MSSPWNSPEHRARELLNLVHMSDRCARLPNIDEAERRRWRLESRLAWDALQPLLPQLRRGDRGSLELVTLAGHLAEELDLPGRIGYSRKTLAWD